MIDRDSAMETESGGGATSTLDKRQRAIADVERRPAFLQLLLDVTTAANEAPSLEDALPLTLECVRAHTGWPVGHACLLDASGALVSTGFWSTDDREGFAALRERTAAIRFARGMGLPGRVLASGRAEAVTNVSADGGFLRADVAADLGVRAAFAFPVRTGSEITAVLEFFSRRSIEPDREFLEVMEHVGTQLGRLIDRQRAREAADEARRRAEEAARLRDDVLRMVSHDLRNPLNTIFAATALLQDLSLEAGQRDQQIEMIRRAARHMRRLVEDLVDIERIEAGHGVRIDPKSVDPRRLLDEAFLLVGPQAEAKGIHIVRAGSPQLPPVRADFERVLQVLWNLVGNAMKFTPASGQIVISAEPQLDAVMFAVTDTGPGIRAEDVDRLFEAYWQSTRNRRLGSGLGLPISKGIVESHGGRIWVDTAPGRGSTFRFTIPLLESRVQ